MIDSQCSLVSIVTELRAVWPGFDF